jgi:prepilin-type N-terminal cleavage/methylation domain-containing protein
MRMKNRSGMTLIEVMIAVMVFSFAITVFASLYPLAMRMRSKSENVTRATAIAQQKIEQIRALPYTSLTFSALRAENVVDASPTSQPWSFTSVDSLSGKLPEASGTISISDAGSGANTSDLKRVDITVSWGGIVNNGHNTLTVSTTLSNKEVRSR